MKKLYDWFQFVFCIVIILLAAAVFWTLIFLLLLYVNIIDLDSPKPIEKPKTSVEYKVDRTIFYLDTIIHNNHQYIVSFKSNSAESVGITHSPDCEYCKSKLNTE